MLSCGIAPRRAAKQPGSLRFGVDGGVAALLAAKGQQEQALTELATALKMKVPHRRLLLRHVRGG